MFPRCRDKSKGLLLENNTRLVQCGDSYGIKLHQTVVVEIHSNNTFTLNTGGWFTVTTTARINSYSPAYISQSKGVWYLKDGTAFSDSVVITASGKTLNSPNSKRVNEHAKIRTAIDKYVTEYAKALKSKSVPAPSGGDCWGCCMRDKDGQTVMGTGHLLEHMTQGYLVPSLLVNALSSKGYNPVYMNPWTGFGDDTTLFKRALKSYLTKELIK